MISHLNNFIFVLFLAMKNLNYIRFVSVIQRSMIKFRDLFTSEKNSFWDSIRKFFFATVITRESHASVYQCTEIHAEGSVYLEAELLEKKMTLNYESPPDAFICRYKRYITSTPIRIYRREDLNNAGLACACFSVSFFPDGNVNESTWNGIRAVLFLCAIAFS